LLHLGELLVAHAGQNVAGENQLGFAGGDPRRVNILGIVGDAHIRDDRTGLLRKSGHVEHAAAFAFEMRGHAEQRADRDDAGPADAGDDDAVRFGSRNRHGIGQRRDVVGLRFLRLAQAAADDGDEARAKAVDTGEILVARALVDRALAAEFRLHGGDRHAVRFHAAVAAAFADELVDEDALRWIGILAALPAPTLFGRARLVVEQDRAAIGITQRSLNGVEIVAMMDRNVRRVVTGRILVRFVGDNDDFLHTLGGDLLRDIGRCERAVEWLPAGPPHRVVVRTY